MTADQTIDAGELRRRAEERLANQTSPSDAPLPAHQMQRLLQELRIHQIELEMQNEELQRAYAELEISQERYFDLYDLAPVGYATVSEAGIIQEANLTMASLLGVTREALAKQPLSRFIFRDDVDLYLRGRGHLFTTAESQVSELQMVRPDGTTWWVHLVMSFTQQAGVPECRVVLSDITDRKRAEESLLAMKDDLERQVELRTGELQEAQAQYLHAEKLSAIGQLSSSIAHEMNNPLQGIKAILQGVKRRAIMDEEDKELVNVALGETDRLKNLIAGLREFQLPSMDQRTAMDVHASLDFLLLLYKSEFKRHRISTVLNYAAGLPRIEVIPDQIKQVFLNLSRKVEGMGLTGRWTAPHASYPLYYPLSGQMPMDFMGRR